MADRTHATKPIAKSDASPGAQSHARPASSPSSTAASKVRRIPQPAHELGHIAIRPPESTIQRRERSTGLPDNLKAGIERLSGVSMDDVKVHYNSSRPHQVAAHAYTQGTQIHIARGQEEHLPHEAWHVVQQKQRRVKPTLRTRGVAINDDSALEREADLMGTKAASADRAPREEGGSGGHERPSPAGDGGSSTVVQRVENIVLAGRKTTTFTLRQAAKLAVRELEDEEGYEDITEEEVEAALGEFEGNNRFDSKDAFIDQVRALIPPRAVERKEGEGIEGGDEASSSEEEIGALDARAFTGAIKATLGANAGDEDLVGFYVEQLATVIERLNGGQSGVRWLTLEPAQKREVLNRLIQGMVALGNSQGNPAEFFGGNTTILHGSYLFGAAREQPGDIDLISHGRERLGKKVGIAGHLDREPADDKFSVGAQAGVLDYIGGIPFSEAGETANLATDSPAVLRDAAAEDLTGYIRAAESEEDPGKQWRKYVNIAVAIDYLLRRFGIESTLTPFIQQANQAIVGGAPPKAGPLAAAIEGDLKKLRAAQEEEV